MIFACLIHVHGCRRELVDLSKLEPVCGQSQYEQLCERSNWAVKLGSNSKMEQPDHAYQ